MSDIQEQIPLKRRHPAGYIPAEMREAMGLPESAKTVKLAMEDTQKVQEMLTAAESITDDTVEVLDQDGNVVLITKGRGPSMGVTHEQVRHRNERIVGLSMSGMTHMTILKNINAEAAAHGWGKLQDIRSVRRIISQHYAAQRPSAKEQRDHDDGMRDAMFEQQERLLEKAMLYFTKRENSKDPWKPFEYFSAIDVIARIRQTLIENRNWNASRMNPLVINQFNATQLNVFDRNAADLQEHQDALKPVLALLDSYLEGPQQ